MSEENRDTSVQKAEPKQMVSELCHDAAAKLEPIGTLVSDLVASILHAATNGLRKRSRDNLSLDANVVNSKSSEGSESESSESSFTSSSSSSSSGSPELEKPSIPLKRTIDAVKELVEEDKTDTEEKHLRSRNEIDPDTIKVPRPNIIVSADDEIYPVGEIMSVLESVVIVSTDKDCLLEKNSKSPHMKANHISASQAKNLNLVSALDHDSVLCFENRQLFGLIDETFGPVDNPFYVVRFNNEQDRDAAGATKGRTVFAVKHKSKWVKGSELQTKGYDTSNCNDEEVTGADDFSDDEEERAAKQAQKKAKKREAEPATANSAKRRRFGQPNITREVRGKHPRYYQELHNGRLGARNFAVRQTDEPNPRALPQHMYDPMTPSMWHGNLCNLPTSYHPGQLPPANSVHSQKSEALLAPASLNGSASGIPQPFYSSGAQVPRQVSNQIPPVASSDLHGPQGIPFMYSTRAAGNPIEPRHSAFLPPGSLHAPVAPGSADHSNIRGPAPGFHEISQSATIAGLGTPGNPNSQHQYTYQNPNHVFPPPPMFLAPGESIGQRHYGSSYYPGVSNVYNNEAYGRHQSRMNDARTAYMPSYRGRVEQARYAEPHRGREHTARPPPRSYPPDTGGHG